MRSRGCESDNSRWRREDYFDIDFGFVGSNMPGYGAYAASKAAMEAMTRILGNGMHDGDEPERKIQVTKDLGMQPRQIVMNQWTHWKSEDIATSLYIGR